MQQRQPEVSPEVTAHEVTARRAFLRTLGITGAIACLPGFLASCAKDANSPLAPKLAPDLALATSGSAAAAVTLDFSSDLGVLNYAYALEQLEAAFYNTVVSAFPSGFSSDEQRVFTDVRIHEVIHREFFRTALGSHAITALTPDFSSIDFRRRDSVLEAAKAFEDLGVAAYNGAGQLLKNNRYLAVAGKIVSVEARHAAAIRDLLDPRSRNFAGDDVINAQGLDRAFPPDKVLQMAGSFVRNKITITNLPSTVA